MKKGLWEESKTIWCNCCQKHDNKHTETQEIDNNIYCLKCNNWLCGFFDAWGYRGEEDEMS